MPKRRKRGRPATGHDPILGVRVPAKIIRKIDRLAEALSTDRSAVVRRLLVRGLDFDAYLLRAGKGKGVAQEYLSVVAATVRAKGAEAAIARTKPHEKLAAEIKAHRAMLEAIAKASAIGDRIALRRAKMTAPRPREEPPPTPAYKPGRARWLSEAEVKAAVDRAVSRSRRS